MRAAGQVARRRAPERDVERLGRARVVAMLADLRRVLFERYGTADARALEASLRRVGPIRVPVAFHVIVDGPRGMLSLSDVELQVRTLNDAYSGQTGGADTGVAFRLDAYDVTDNAAWFNDPQRHESTFKKALHRGGAGTLNLYSAAVGVDVLGFSTFPQWYRKRSAEDGVVIDYRSVPGGAAHHFNRGYTAVHETGHWLGLFHTFENGCEEPGDGVSDTPPEAEATEGCPAHKDTCLAPGSDPIHNFMDYAWDDCMREFTPGQGSRIRQAWIAYRSSAAR